MNQSIKNICLEKIPEAHRFVILSGTGGLGKSMMMTHFTLGIIKKHGINGKIPIFAVLWNYSPETGDVIDFIFQEFNRHDPELKLPEMIELLSSGRAVVLLDENVIDVDIQKDFIADLKANRFMMLWQRSRMRRMH